MRRIPIAPLVLLVVVVGWAIVFDQSGSEKVWKDISTLGQAAVHGKWDQTAGKQVLPDAGSVIWVSFANTTKQIQQVVNGNSGTTADAAASGSMAAAGNTAPGANTPIVRSGPVAKKIDWDGAVVLIKGDTAEGTGFLVHMPDGPVVVTNLHVISANPHFHVLTNDGREIPVLSIRGASDRDLALLSIQDDHYHYLQLASDDTTAAQPGDEVITPGNSEGGEVTLDTSGKMLGLGPDRIEISNPIFHGNSGGPVVEKGSGQVVGVVTFAMTRNPTDLLDQSSRANPNSAITSDTRYFGLRLDTVPQWQPYAMDEFALQSNFLRNFHENSVCIDSILNGAKYEKAGLTKDGAPTATYYTHNRELAAEVNPHMIDDPEHVVFVEDVRVAVLDLVKFGQRDMDSIQNAGNFYSFEWKRAQEEATYRRALMKELQSVNDKIN